MKTLKIKVDLTPESQVKAWELSNYNVEIWNWGNEQRKELLNQGKFASAFDQCYELPGLKKLHPEYKECASQTLQLTLKELGIAWDNTWKLRKGFPDKNHHLPRFKSRKYFNTLTFVSGLYFEDNRLYGLNKLNNLITFISPIDIPYKVFSNKSGIAKLSYNRGTKEFYVSIPYNHVKEVKSDTKGVIAFDLGIKTLGVGIDQDKNILEITNTVKPVVKYFDKRSDQVRSKRDKCKKHSRRYRRLSKIMAKLQTKKEGQIKTINSKISRTLTGMEYQTIVVGDLEIRDMVVKESELPVKVEKRINRAIHQQWLVNRFVNHLSYTASNAGEEVVKINECGTTRTCNNCGHVFPDGLDPSIRVYNCPDCLMSLDRDINSAVNIFNRYQSQKYSCGMNPPMRVTDISNFRRATLKVGYNYVGVPNVAYN